MTEIRRSETKNIHIICSQTNLKNTIMKMKMKTCIFFTNYFNFFSSTVSKKMQDVVLVDCCENNQTMSKFNMQSKNIENIVISQEINYN